MNWADLLSNKWRKISRNWQIETNSEPYLATSWNVEKAHLELGGINLECWTDPGLSSKEAAVMLVFVFMGVSIYSPGDTLLARTQTNKQNQWKYFGCVQFVVLLGYRYVRFAVKFVRAMNLIRTPVITSEEHKCFKCKHACVSCKIQCRTLVWSPTWCTQFLFIYI